MTKTEYRAKLDQKLEKMPNNVYLKYLDMNYKRADFDSKICVQIPDYCDPEMISTMKSCVEAAANPDRIHFSVCYQGDDLEELERIKSFKNCKVKHIAKKDAPGLCAARYECTKMTENVDFVFHIDSHMRFAEFWDVGILQQWSDCNDNNAILSAYALNYKDTIDEPLVSDKRLPETFNGKYVNAQLFIPSGKLRFVSAYKFGNEYTPRKSPFIGGHCTFMPLHIDKDVPSDPNMNFIADEISMAVRYWTHGYDIYQFGILFIYHLYGRMEIMPSRTASFERFNTDNNAGSIRVQNETKRMNKLFGLTKDPTVDLTGFDIGTARTIDEYQEFAGVEFKNRIITQFAAKGAYDVPHTDKDYNHYDYSDESKEINATYGNFIKYKDMTIAILLYAVHESENLPEFIKNMYETAAYPERLHFYIAHTGIDNKTINDLKKQKEYEITFKSISEYKGRQYGYNTLETMYRDETYALYLSATVIPETKWDAYYINILQKLGRKAFVSEELETTTKKDINITGISNIDKNKNIATISNHRSDAKYARGAIIKHNMLFIAGEAVKICPHDPYLEGMPGVFSHSIRLWTNGYDMYHINGARFIRHKNIPTPSETEYSAANEFCKSSLDRIKKLYGLDDNDIDLTNFGLGKERTLETFEKYTGMNIKESTISINTIIGRFGSEQTGILSKQFDPKILKNIVSKEKDKSISKFASSINNCIASFEERSDISKVLNEYDVFETIKTKKKENAKNMSITKNELIDIINDKKQDPTHLYTIKDALEIMFKGKKLQDAIKICHDILSKSVNRVGSTIETSYDGIYFNIDNSHEKVNGKKPTLAISRFTIDNVPTVIVDNVESTWRYLAAKVLQRSKSRNVLITGSNGKTTTKCIVSEILKLDCDNDNRFVCSVKNENGFVPFCKDVGIDFDDVRYYVKEFGIGGKSNVLTSFSKQLCPDISVIVNIGESCHTEGNLNSRQDVFDTKIKCIDGLKSDGVLIINKDDDMLRSNEYPCEVITVALEDKSADYTCEDIIEENDHMTFTAVCPDRKIKNCRMNVHGTHNIYGALIGIAVADRFNVSDDKILKGLAAFQYDGERQTIYKAYKNNTIIYDCFGCSIESDVTMLKSLMSLKLPEGARRIAYLGHMATTGRHAERLHRKLAEIIASDFDLDLLICFGGKSRYFYEEYIKAGKKAVYFNDDIEAMCYIRNELKENDAILVKGCGAYKFGQTFKDNIEKDDLSKPVYKGTFADNNEFHGVARSMLYKNINTDETYIDKYADEKRIPFHVTMMYIITALCEIYENRMNERAQIKIPANIFRKYYIPSSVINKEVTAITDSSKTYSIAELIRIALDYTALDVIYFLIEQVGKNEFKEYLDKFLERLDCRDTIIIDPQSYDMNKNVTTANDLYKVTKYFTELPVFETIININTDPLVNKRLYDQKSKLLREYDNYDEEDTYCDSIILAEKMYDRTSSSCVAIAKINGEYIACITLDRGLVYRNHANEVDISRAMKELKRIKES